MKILVADDDPQLVRALRITLAAHGYDVVAAPDGAAAVTLAAQTHPDIVLLDLGMPHLDGVQVIEALRGWTSVPIIVVSGRTGSADKVEALDAGADDYVTKPFQIDELLARLRALTRRTAPAGGDPVVGFADVAIDLSTKAVTRGGSARAPHTDRVADARVPRPQPRRARDAADTPEGDLGERAASATPATCGCTCRSCARSSKRTPHGRSTCSPSPGWATASSSTPPKWTAG